MRWRLAIAAALIALIIVLVWWPSSRRQRRAGTRGEGGVSAAAGGADGGGVTPSGEPRPTGQLPGAAANVPDVIDGPPIIDEVTLEKDEVCADEENLVTVTARSASGDDRWLQIEVAGGFGSRVPVRFGRDAFLQGNLEVRVRDRNGAETRAPIPPLSFKPCTETDVLTLNQRWLPGQRRLAELNVELTEATRLEPVRYRWDFGDGGQSETTVPRATHDYSAVPQDRLFSQVVVRCEAIDAAGRSISGRLSLPIRNWEFQRLHLERRIVVMADQRDVRGDRFAFHVWHLGASPVTITRITSIETTAEQLSRETAPDAAPAKEVPVSAVLGDATLAPAGRDVELALPAGLAALSYHLEGTSEGGLEVSGDILLVRAELSGVPGRMARDPRYREKVRRARKLLGKSEVTEAEIGRIHKQFPDIEIGLEGVDDQDPLTGGERAYEEWNRERRARQAPPP